MLPLHKIQWKIPLANAKAVDPWDFFRAFSAWIGNSDEILIDVVDYRHVPDGVKIILVGHDADYVLDDADGVTGLVYARKMPFADSDQEHFAFALKKALSGVSRLENDPIFSGKLEFDRKRLVFIANDRAAAPNTRESFAAIKSAVEASLSQSLPGVNFRLDYLDDDPRGRLRILAVQSD